MRKLKDFAIVTRDDKHVYISHKKVIKLQKNEIVEIVIDKLRTGFEAEELYELIGEVDTENLLNILEKHDLLIDFWEHSFLDTIVEKQVYYLEQFNVDPILAQAKLNNATVVILGVGGVGSVILQNLLGSGIMNFVVIDSDYVTISNLNRQFLYTRESIGRLKIEEAKRYIQSVNNQAQVTCYKKRIEKVEDFAVLDNLQFDVLVNAADTPSTITDLSLKYAKQRDVGFITGGVGVYSGSWGPFLTNESYERNISYSTNYNGQEFDPIKASLGATNTVISAQMAYDIILFLIGLKPKSFESIISMNFETTEMKKYPI
ncbi:ThiF family adenylyltransferase [Paenibacillus sp. NPDC057934]|uniref:ThiF family adenylyltransferase n=1 Tax=Paenibacillus sp. NPDC057934 TaxID=3346282 RepID=UPI0036DCB47B